MLLSILLACSAFETGPSYVDKGDIQSAVARKNIKNICAGLQMDDPEVQQYATEQLRIFDPKDTKECLCTHIADPNTGYKEAVAEGLRDESRNALASCFTDLVLNPEMKNRENAIIAMSKLTAPIVNKSLMDIATNTADDPKTRAKAIRSIGGYKENFDDIAALVMDNEPVVKAAVIETLGIHNKEKGARKLIQESLKSESAEVRAAAMIAYHKHVRKKAEPALCTAMLEDESPLVRQAAILAFKGTKRTDPILCLRKKALNLEEDRDVRAVLLEVLTHATGDAKKNANTILCDAIPYWLRNYVTDKLPEEDPETDIVKMQNEYDHENSEKCFVKAYAQRKTYSCHANKYISWYYKQVSGKDDDFYVPSCPGDDDYEEKKGKK